MVYAIIQNGICVRCFLATESDNEITASAGLSGESYSLIPMGDGVPQFWLDHPEFLTYDGTLHYNGPTEYPPVLETSELVNRRSTTETLLISIGVDATIAANIASTVIY